MLRPTADAQELTQLLNLGAILTVSSQNDAAVLNGVAETLGVQAQVHVKIDTGMGRYGFLPDELDQLLPIFKYMPSLHVTGIYTHLHSAFCNQKATIAQAEAFQGVLDKLARRGLRHRHGAYAELRRASEIPRIRDGRRARRLGHPGACVCARKLGSCPHRRVSGNGGRTPLASEGPQLRLRRGLDSEKTHSRGPCSPWAGTTGSAWRWETTCSVSATVCAAFCGI